LQSGISERKLFGRFIICLFVCLFYNLFLPSTFLFHFANDRQLRKKQLIKEKQKPAKLIVPGKTSKAFKI
jgi:hypothetical protein